MTKNKIKKAALELFVKGGYEGARLADIAAAVNIKPPSLYFHFESKEKLFIEVFDDLLNKRLDYLNTVRQELNELTSAKDQLRHIYNDYSARAKDNQDERVFWKRTALFPPNFLKERVRNDMIAYERQFEDVLVRPVLLWGMKAREIKRQDVERCIVAFISLTAAAFTEIHYSDPDTYRERLEILWDFFWDSIKS